MQCARVSVSSPCIQWRNFLIDDLFCISKISLRDGSLGLLLLFAVTSHLQANDSREIHGRVVDEQGQAVPDVSIAVHWSANGSNPPQDEAGKVLDPSSAEGLRALTDHTGKMAPYFPEQSVKSDVDGRYSLSVPDIRHHLLAMDSTRRRGALVNLLTSGNQAKIEIQLSPLVRIHGSIDGLKAGVRPQDVFYILARPPHDAAHPLDHSWLASCVSLDGRFEMWLPRGRYTLDAHALRESPNGGIEDARVIPSPKIDVKGNRRKYDVGALHLSAFKRTLSSQLANAKATGTWDDIKQHYGEQAPRWHVTDARGAKKDVQVSDFKGKWVLVYFWGPSCIPCMREGIPKLMEFYDEHAADRDRFEIISFVIDVDDELNSIAELDEKILSSVVKHVWGKPVPFPTLFDTGFTTWERFGLSTYGTLILIDPEGRLVKGDETDLAKTLQKEP